MKIKCCRPTLQSVRYVKHCKTFQDSFSAILNGKRDMNRRAHVRYRWIASDLGVMIKRTTFVKLQCKPIKTDKIISSLLSSFQLQR